MNAQLSIDDALAARAEALAAVDAHADPLWKDQALAAVRRVCELRQDFHVDDSWTLTDLPSTREDRALGPIMLKAARLGYCRKTDRVRPSARSHGSGKPVWTSLIFAGSATETAA